MRKHLLNTTDELKALMFGPLKEHHTKPQLALVFGDPSAPDLVQLYRDRNASMDAQPYLTFSRYPDKSYGLVLNHSGDTAELVGQIFRNHDLLLLAASCDLCDKPKPPNYTEPVATYYKQQRMLASLPDPDFVWLTS